MNTPRITWRKALASYWDKRAIIICCLGFSAGLPLLLIFSSLSLWLREAGVDRGTVTLFSWAALAYSFKFVWAPLADILPLPFLSRTLGRRRAWLLFAQIGVAFSIFAMGFVNPQDENGLLLMAVFVVALGFFAATQDVVIDAYRIEIAPIEMQSVLSACYTAAYRIGMIVAGAGALYLASFLGASETYYYYPAWRHTYWLMALCMGVGIICTLCMAEPKQVVNKAAWHSQQYLHLFTAFLLFITLFCSVFYFSRALYSLWGATSGFAILFIELCRISLAMLAVYLAFKISCALKFFPLALAKTAWLTPLTDFFARYGKKAFVLLAIIGLYRISDIVAGVISNVFYQDLGYSKNEIATAVKMVGVIISILGGFVGGLIAQRMEIMKVLFIGGIFACLTNLLFVLLSFKGYDLFYFYLAIIADNFSAGLASAVFVAFLSALTNIKFTAVQYALFSSAMSLLPKVIGGYSGTMVNSIGYAGFFTFATLIGLPALVLIYWLGKQKLLAQSNA